MSCADISASKEGRNGSGEGINMLDSPGMLAHNEGMDTTHCPQTLLDAIRYFSDPIICLDFVAGLPLARRHFHLPPMPEQGNQIPFYAIALEVQRVQKGR